jgi:hypothetical protein
MVSKLYLASFEVVSNAMKNNEHQNTIEELISHFETIGDGIGIHKAPNVYGAFPTDPYSHTPFGKGAQQPGMTGQVKEDILTRTSELGVGMNAGKLQFQPHLLQKKEFLLHDIEATFILVDGTKKAMTINKDCLAFTVCQVPVVYKISTNKKIEVHNNDGTNQVFETLELNIENSKKIVNRTGEISHIIVYLKGNSLR